MGDLKLTTIKLGRNKICCAEDNHNNVSNITCVQKNSQIQTLIKHKLAKYRFFPRNSLIFHKFTKMVIFKV